MDYHEFKISKNKNEFSDDKYSALVNQIQLHGPRMEGSTSLGFCFSSTTTTTTPPNNQQKSLVLKIRPYSLPLLRGIDFTNTVVDSSIAVQFVFKTCSRLEKPTY